MNPDSEFPFDRARRVTPEEHQRFQTMLKQQFAAPSNQSSAPEAAYESVSLQLHPQILVWAKAEAQKRGIAYQTVINEILLQQANAANTSAG